LRHEANLLEFSRLATVANRSDTGGREWIEYWLTESQCLYLAAKSETPVARNRNKLERFGILATVTLTPGCNVLRDCICNMYIQ